MLFDLDGTLLDTAADIALALNRTLAECGWSRLRRDDVRRMIGRGSPILIERPPLRRAASSTTRRKRPWSSDSFIITAP